MTTDEKLKLLLAAAKALRDAYDNASPTKVKAQAWLALRAAIRASESK